MFNFFKKKRVENDFFLPYNLKIGAYIEFDPIIFSNLGLDSKILFSEYKNIVKEIGILETGGVKLVNIYLESDKKYKSYIHLIFSGEEIEKCILFKNYDNVFPSTEEEWFTWLGDDSNCGIIGDQNFTIEDTIDERIQDILSKIIKKEFPDFNDFDDAKVELKDNIFQTDLLHRIATHQGLAPTNIIEIIKKNLEGQNWITKVDQSLLNTKFYIDSSLAQDTLLSEYKNYYSTNRSIRFEEKIYSNKNEDSKISLNKNYGLYSRKIYEEFFKYEFINLSSITNNEGAYISIDIGIELPAIILGKI